MSVHPAPSASDMVDPEAMPEAIERSIADWLKRYLVDLLDVSLDEIDEQTSFERYELDSLVSVGLVADLGDWLDYELDPAAPNDFPSIQSLARELAADERVRAAYLRRIGRSS